MTGAHGQVRIIGGAWRGRRVRFLAAGVRPTPDRVRETLFNWLHGTLPGARVVDLFAGSGVLAFEALSRGAASAVLVERDAAQATQLAAEAARLGARAAQVRRADALAVLAGWRGSAAGVDLLFVDPPYAAGLTGRVLAECANATWLAPHARVYVETPARETPPVPSGWALHRSGRAGEVGYHLLTRGEA